MYHKNGQVQQGKKVSYTNICIPRVWPFFERETIDSSCWLPDKGGGAAIVFSGIISFFHF